MEYGVSRSGSRVSLEPKKKYECGSQNLRFFYLFFFAKTRVLCEPPGFFACGSAFYKGGAIIYKGGDFYIFSGGFFFWVFF